VGVQERDFSKLNEINDFAIISFNRNDLALADFRRHLRPFAGFCRFSQRDGTRNGTRRERLPNSAASLLTSSSKQDRGASIQPRV
jgi:hypothetical protein